MASVYPPAYAPRFSVKIGGTEFPEYDYISDLVVDTTIDGADHFSITLTYPFDHEQVSFTDLQWNRFKPGTSVTIKLGYGEGDNAAKEVFKGSIETVKPEFPTHDPPKAVISGYSPLREMMRGTNSTSWKKKKLKKVVSSKASTYLDSVKTEQAEFKFDRLFQDGESDYRFVKRLAEKYGYEFFSSLGTGYFRPKTGGKSPEDPVAELYYGESLESFSAELTSPDHGEVEVRHWDESKKQKIVGSASNSNGSGKEVYRVPVTSSSEAKKIAQSKLDGQSIEGVAETFGIPSVKAGKVVKMDGLGPKFSGKYYVTGATHRMGESGYRMTIEITKL